MVPNFVDAVEKQIWLRKNIDMKHEANQDTCFDVLGRILFWVTGSEQRRTEQDPVLGPTLIPVQGPTLIPVLGRILVQNRLRM